MPVTAASLTQQGQQLVWQVVLAAPFSPGALGRDGRTLCLLIDHATAGGVSGRLCVAGPGAHSSTPRVLFTPNGGAERVIASAVTRSSARELTARFLPT
ncbi:MAG: hypothetical protein JO304_21800, partial [Solirubrobacterales bacterium]|nr:hypothetical protein [Solirubrobacterales bacterium]